jgi:hypothetical protein
MVRPPHAGVVDGGMCNQVVDQLVGEVEVVTTLDDAVTGEGQDAGRPTAAAVVVPEPGPDPTPKSGLADRAPTAVTERGPRLVRGDLSEQPKDLGVASWAVAPAVALPLDQVRTVGWVRMGNEEAIRAGLVAAHHVRCPGQGHVDHVLSVGRMAYSGQRIHDAQRPVRKVVRPGRRWPAGQLTPPRVRSAVVR